MLVMGFSASILGFLKSPTDGNVFTGFMTAYFVGTALTTVRPASPWTRRINAVALTIVVALALGTIVSGVKAVNDPGLSPGGVPFRTIGVMSFVLATVMSLAAIGDVRILLSGMPQGGRRLARHLWRMCFALFIAAGSFFSIRPRVAKILPIAPEARPADRAVVRRVVLLAVEVSAAARCGRPRSCAGRGRVPV